MQVVKRRRICNNTEECGITCNFLQNTQIVFSPHDEALKAFDTAY